MLVEVGLQLLPGFIGIQHKLLPRAKGQPAKVAVSITGRSSNKANDPEIPVSHGNIMAVRQEGVKLGLSLRLRHLICAIGRRQAPTQWIHLLLHGCTIEWRRIH
jgi:hypothetical protein